MNKKFLAYIFSVVFLTCYLTSCNNLTENIKENEESLTIESENKSLDTETDDLKTVETISVDYSIWYYDIIDDKIYEYADTQDFEGKVTPEFFIEKLSSLMQMRIDVNSINIENEKMIIDFSSNSAPLNGTGSYEENCILESISDIMFSVFSDVNSIYFTADGKDYESGHVSLSKDTPYAQR